MEDSRHRVCFNRYTLFRWLLVHSLILMCGFAILAGALSSEGASGPRKTQVVTKTHSGSEGASSRPRRTQVVTKTNRGKHAQQEKDRGAGSAAARIPSGSGTPSMVSRPPSQLPFSSANIGIPSNNRVKSSQGGMHSSQPSLRSGSSLQSNRPAGGSSPSSLRPGSSLQSNRPAGGSSPSSLRPGSSLQSNRPAGGSTFPGTPSRLNSSAEKGRSTVPSRIIRRTKTTETLRTIIPRGSRITTTTTTIGGPHHLIPGSRPIGTGIVTEHLPPLRLRPPKRGGGVHHHPHHHPGRYPPSGGGGAPPAVMLTGRATHIISTDGGTVMNPIGGGSGALLRPYRSQYPRLPPPGSGGGSHPPETGGGGGTGAPPGSFGFDKIITESDAGLHGIELPTAPVGSVAGGRRPSLPPGTPGKFIRNEINRQDAILMEPPAIDFNLSDYPVSDCTEMSYCDGNKGICTCAVTCHCVPLADFPKTVPLPAMPPQQPVESPILSQPPTEPEEPILDGPPQIDGGAGDSNQSQIPEDSEQPQQPDLPEEPLIPEQQPEPPAPPTQPILPPSPPPPPPPPPKILYEGESPYTAVTTTKYSSLSNPNNPNVGWCWKLARPIKALKNWAWLVEFRECVSDPSSMYLQESRENVVCTETGGVEITHLPFDSKFPFKLGCIDRDDAMKSEETSCWKLTGSSKLQMKLQRVQGGLGKDICSKFNLKLPFGDGKHVSSRFSSAEGGIATLYHCNGGHYTSAVVPYRLSASGKFEGYENVICQPTSPTQVLACRGMGIDCMHHLQDAVMENLNRAPGF